MPSRMCIYSDFGKYVTEVQWPDEYRSLAITIDLEDRRHTVDDACSGVSRGIDVRRQLPRIAITP